MGQSVERLTDKTTIQKGVLSGMYRVWRLWARALAVVVSAAVGPAWEAGGKRRERDARRITGPTFVGYLVLLILSHMCFLCGEYCCARG